MDFKKEFNKLKEAEDIVFEIYPDSNPVYLYKKAKKYKEKYYGKKKI